VRAARLAAALCALWVLPASAARAQAPSTDDLARLRSAIEESRTRVTHFEREERGLLDALEAIERTSALLERDLARARRRAAAARTALAEAEASVKGSAEAVAALERAMSRRAVALYRTGELGALPLLFSAGDLREFLSRVQVLRRLLSHDAKLLARHRQAEAALRRAHQVAAEAAEERSAAQAALDERSQQLRAERDRKQGLATQMRRSRTHERAALAELEIASQALETAVAALPEGGIDRSERAPERSFASQKARLEPPVKGPVARGFGLEVDPEFRTETFRKGVVFDVPEGTPVRAVAAGRVRYAGRFRGYGNTVIVDHGEQYFTVSAHLSELAVAVGDWVDSGEAIGQSGESGSLSGAQLYFEVRRGGAALDPRKWLRLLGTSASTR
jgi:septal ring factor EnvC (AmiA/AmiB activator)